MDFKMNSFTTKKSMVIMITSILLLFAFSTILLFSNGFINLIHNFLQTEVFHRTFKLEKWITTIESLFLIPLFLIILINAIIFPNYTEKQKIILVISLILDFSFLILWSTFIHTNAHTNADLASELLLAKECLLEHTPLPTGWCYSTEIRFINTQLISAPIFLFTDNWNLVKTFTSFFCCAGLFLACYYVLNQLKIKTLWLKFLLCTFIVIPFSFSSWYVISWGTYYIPHTIFALIYVGLFIKLTCNEPKHKKITQYIFWIWAFLSGLSSIRYIMNFVFPLTLAIIILEISEYTKPLDNLKNIKDLCLNNNLVKNALIGIVLSGFGYIANIGILERFFTFSNWSKIDFCTYGSVKIIDLIKGILFNFGYQENIAVFTVNGIINILIYCAITLFIIMIIKILKSKLEVSKRQSIYLVFFITSILFESFVYFHTEFLQRYYTPLLLLLIPCLGILYESNKFSKTQKYILLTLWSVILITSSFTTIQHSMVTDENKDKYEVANFLKEKGYAFGYATFANANTITHLTNGKVAVGNFGKRTGQDGTAGSFDNYSYSKWLTPKRYYNSNWNNDAIFFLVTAKEFEENSEKKIFSNGKKVFSNEFYKVFEYDNNEKFINSFGE